MSLLCQSYTQVYGARHAWAYTPAVAADAEPTGLVRDFSGVPGRHGYVMTSVPASQPASQCHRVRHSLSRLFTMAKCMHARYRLSAHDLPPIPSQACMAREMLRRNYCATDTMPCTNSSARNTYLDLGRPFQIRESDSKLRHASERGSMEPRGV
jgi:hypothetical protein